MEMQDAMSVWHGSSLAGCLHCSQSPPREPSLLLLPLDIEILANFAFQCSASLSMNSLMFLVSSFHTLLLVCHMVQNACSCECSILFPNTSDSCNGSLHWQSQVVTTSTEGVSYCGHQSPNPNCRFIIFTCPCISHKEKFHLLSGSWLTCRHRWLGQPWFDLCL